MFDFDNVNAVAAPLTSEPPRVNKNLIDSTFRLYKSSFKYAKKTANDKVIQFLNSEPVK